MFAFQRSNAALRHPASDHRCPPGRRLGSYVGYLTVENCTKPRDEPNAAELQTHSEQESTEAHSEGAQPQRVRPIMEHFLEQKVRDDTHSP